MKGVQAMNKPIMKRICSVLLSAVLAFPTFLISGFTAGGEEETKDNPTLSFQNEKYDGIKVFKNIYSNEEYLKKNRKPIRETNPEPGDTYDVNELAYDEFRLVLYGSNNKDELYNASERPPLKSIPYQRKSESLLYYNIKINKTENGKQYDLIIAPHDINNYFLYYSNEDGTIDIVFDSKKDSVFLTYNAETATDDQKAQYTSYVGKTYHEKFLMDGGYYSAINVSDTNTSDEDKAKYALFKNYLTASTEFFTDATDGHFFIFDGDITYFDESHLNTVKYVRVKEEWEFIRELNTNRKSNTNSANYTGEYIYMIDDDVVTDVIASSQSGTLEVANRFDTPTHELTVSKTVPFFGVAPSDVNPFRTLDTFEYKLLINEKVPASIQYTLLDTKTNTIKPTADEAEKSNVVQVGDSYRYVAENGKFYLYAEESATFYGVKSGDSVEIREYTNPDRYSVLNELSGNANFKYVKAADSTEEPKRDYASITIQYGDEQNQRYNPTFTNVPNVLQVRKRIEAVNINEDKSFQFTLQRITPAPNDSTKPYMFDGKYITDCEILLDENQRPIPQTDENSQIIKDEEGNTLYQTKALPVVNYTYYLRNGDSNFNPSPRLAENGVFELKHEQTAMFVGLKANTMYLVTESSDSSYNLRGENSRVIWTRGETVDDALIRSKSGNYYELYINELDEMKGIVITKSVKDSDNRLNQKAEYTFRLEKIENNGTYTPVSEMQYLYKDGASNYKEGKTDKNGYFKIKYNINNFIVKFPRANGRYRVTEVDPNDWNDQNNSTGETAPNLNYEEYLYITDVDYSQYNVSDGEEPEIRQNYGTTTYNEDMTKHTDDISVDVSCTLDIAATLDFTNRIREKTYYFDIEKLAYLDDNIHDGKADTTQRFQFKIERFQTMAEALKSDSIPLETFYTDLSCTEKSQITDNGESANPRYTYTSNNEDYNYPFYPVDYTYTGRDNGVDSVKYENEVITRTYKKADTDAVYQKGNPEEYQFISTIYRGYRQIAVKKQGFYRITEIADWSSTDYDYCLKSNRYKGYLNTEENAKNKLFADYETTHTEGYTAENGMLERSVIIYAGALEDKTYPYTLGCEFFENGAGTVKYIQQKTQKNAENEDEPVMQYVQKRDENGNLLYYQSGDSGTETTVKYDDNGNRRKPVEAPLSQFRIQETVTINNEEKLLYFKNDSDELIPVYQYEDNLSDNKLVQEEYEEPVLDEEGNPVTETKTRKEAFSVYDKDKNLITIDGREFYQLTNEEINNEANYKHNNNQFGYLYETVSVEGQPRPMASFSNVESEYALLSSNAWAENKIKRPVS